MRDLRGKMVALFAAWCLALPACASAPGTLPTDSDWRTFAKPLALGHQAMLFFQRDGQRAVMWRVDWSSHIATSTSLSELKLNDKLRFTALQSKDGLWLLGPETLLIRPDGERLVSKMSLNEPVAIALDDGSVAVLGRARGGEGGGIEQLRFNPRSHSIEVIERGPLAHAGAPGSAGPALAPRYGHAVARLKDGRLLMLGGDGQPLLASVISPSDLPGPWPVSAAAPMKHPRIGAAALTLQDGRVVVTGAPRSECHGGTEQARSVEVYDPRANTWAALPPLPMVPCADSFGMDAGTMTETADGTLVVGGYLEPSVQALRNASASPTGFDSSWTLHGPFPRERIGGVLQPVSNTEVVMAGGISNQDGDFGGCCLASPGFDRVSVDGLQGNESIALRLLGVGVAQRGARVFAAAGRRFGFTSTGQLRYSSHAELINLQSGIVRQLPNVPFATGEAQIGWIDDEEVLLKGVQASNDRGFARGENLSSHVPPSSADLAIFNTRSLQWRKVATPAALQDSTLLDVVGRDAFLLSSNGSVQKLNLQTNDLQIVSQLPSGRQGGRARLLRGGRLVIAGGEAPSELVSMMDESCEATPGTAPCPDHYVGFGLKAPASSFEAVTLGASTAGSNYVVSPNVAHHAKSSSTAITKDGTVYILVSDLQDEVHRLVRSRAGIKSWQALPMPAGGHLCHSDCALIAVDDPRDNGGELLFFRQGAIDSTYIDDNVAKEAVKVWLWREPARAWVVVLQTEDGMAARAKPLPLDKQALGTKSQVMMSMGWHLAAPILWMSD